MLDMDFVNEGAAGDDYGAEQNCASAGIIADIAENTDVWWLVMMK